MGRQHCPKIALFVQLRIVECVWVSAYRVQLKALPRPKFGTMYESTKPKTQWFGNQVTSVINILGISKYNECAEILPISALLQSSDQRVWPKIEIHDTS